MDKIYQNNPPVAPKLDITKLTKTKFDVVVPRVDPYFSRMVEQKKRERLEEANASRASENTSNAENREEKDTCEGVTEEPKTEERKEEELSCDVAREAACAQIVWMVPQVTAEEQVETQPIVGEVTEIGEMANVLTAAGEETVLPGELQMDATGEAMAQETVVAAETGLAPEQTVEAAEQIVTDEAEIAQRPETGEFETMAAETDETGGEAVVQEAPLFKDVETAPIKVAEAPARAEAPEVEKQVSDKLVQILESGENRVEIQLQPETLGKLTIELTQNIDGTLNIILNAESAQTRGMLEKTISTLHEALLDRGQQNVQIEVNRGEEAQRQTNQQQDLQDGRSNNHQEQQRRQQERSGEDFLQQLRLGLIDLQEES